MGSLPIFLFNSRLTREKGFDRILELVKRIRDGEIQAILYICSGGDMIPDIEALYGSSVWAFDSVIPENLSTPHVIYYGHVSWARVNELVGKANYFLMPSRFVETFGLSALEGVTAGCPLIAPAIWGLAQFIQEGFAIPPSESQLSGTRLDIQETENFLELVARIVRDFTPEKWISESAIARSIGVKYKPENWYATVQPSMGARVLLVTDYSAPLGGIESFVHFVERTLGAKGHDVDIITSTSGKQKILRYLGLVATAFNIVFALRFMWKIHSYKPDAIWLHSVLRAIGPVGLIPLLWYRGRILITYHDLGYFVPYPRRIERESQIGDQSWKRFREDMHDPLSAISITLKYLSLLCVRVILRRVDTHLIPSEFLREQVARVLRQDQVSTITLHPHVNPHLWLK